MSDDVKKPAGSDLLLDLNFVPTWARQPATRNPYADYTGEESRGRDGFRGGAGDRERSPRRPRPQDRSGSDRRGGDRRAGRPAPRGDGLPAPGGAAPAASGFHSARGGPAFRGSPRGGENRPSEPRLPYELSFLPDRQNLGAAVHRIHAAHRAFPLAELAHMFLSRPALYSIKLESRPLRSPAPGEGTRAAAAAKPPTLFQCTTCHAVFLDREALSRHVPVSHVETFFTVEESAGEPPTGQFKCIVRCPRSGRLLGPPNHHGFNESLTELHAERFGHLTLDEYRATLEMVHEPETIELWKQEYSKRKLYRLKEAPEGTAPMKWMEARAWLREKADRMVQESRRMVVPATTAVEGSDPAIRRAAREAWAREDKFPSTMMFALRPALRHMGMHLFKAGHMTFVTAIHPSPLNPDYAVPSIRDALNYLAAHPGVTRDQMLEDLFQGQPEDDPARIALVKDMRWLIDKGHVIEFFNGTLSVPRGVKASPAESAPAAEA